MEIIFFYFFSMENFPHASLQFSQKFEEILLFLSLTALVHQGRISVEQARTPRIRCSCGLEENVTTGTDPDRPAPVCYFQEKGEGKSLRSSVEHAGNGSPVSKEEDMGHARSACEKTEACPFSSGLLLEHCLQAAPSTLFRTASHKVHRWKNRLAAGFRLTRKALLAEPTGLFLWAG